MAAEPLALKRDAKGPETTPYWIKKFENISGPGIVVYPLTMTAAAIYWVMSMDVTWYSTVYGLLFLVGQGYQVLAFSHHRCDLALQGRAVQDHPAPDRAARPGQAHLCLRDAEHLPGLRAVPDHLVGQPAGGDQLVSRSHSRPLGHHHHPRFHLPLADSVHHAALARPQAQQEAADAGVPVDDLRPRPSICSG